MAVIRPTTKNPLAALKMRWANLWPGVTGDVDYAAKNTYPELAQTADGKDDVEVWQVDSDNALRIGKQALQPMRATPVIAIHTLTGTPTQTFFIAPTAMQIEGITAAFGTANGAALTATITHETGTQATGAGSVVHSGSINLNATANVPQTLTLPTKWANATSVLPAVLSLAAGDRLSIKFSGAVTSLADLVVTPALSPAAKGHMAMYNCLANGSLITQYIFSANRPFTVQKIQVMWGTAASNGGTVTVDVTKDSSTNAPGAGVSLLAAVLSVKTTANTVATPALTATASRLTMAAGDRLAVKYTGTLTALANVCVVIWFTPTYDRKEVSCSIAANGSIATQPFFLADRDYELFDLSEVHKTAGTDGSGVTLAVTIDTPGTAPGGGLVVQTDNTNAGFDLKGTAATVQVGTPATTRNRIVPAGSYISVKLAGTPTTAAGINVTCSLRPRS